MKRFIIYSIAFVFVSCVERKGELETKDAILEFRIDNSSPSFFGFQKFDDSPAISVASMSIDNNFAYLVDRFHGNLKKINNLGAEPPRYEFG